MRRFILDFVYDETLGRAQIRIDVGDESLTALELNESIRSGEMRDQVIDLAEQVFGAATAAQVRAGQIDLVCLDHQQGTGPDRDAPGVAATAPVRQKLDQ
jgi:hypothetical protein